jgi:hypothetical protein
MMAANTSSKYRLLLVIAATFALVGAMSRIYPEQSSDDSSWRRMLCDRQARTSPRLLPGLQDTPTCGDELDELETCLPCDLRHLAFINSTDEIPQLGCNLTEYSESELARSLTRHPQRAWGAFFGDSVLRNHFRLLVLDSPFFQPVFNDSSLWDVNGISWRTTFHLDHVVCCQTRNASWGEPQHCIGRRSFFDFNCTTADIVQQFLSQPGFLSKYCLTFEWTPYLTWGNGQSVELEEKLKNAFEQEYTPGLVTFNSLLHPAMWMSRERFAQTFVSLLDLLKTFQTTSRSQQDYPSNGKPMFIYFLGNMVNESALSGNQIRLSNDRIEMFNSDILRISESKKYENMLTTIDSNRLFQRHTGTKFVAVGSDGYHPIPEFYNLTQHIFLNVVIRRLPRVCQKPADQVIWSSNYPYP